MVHAGGVHGVLYEGVMGVFVRRDGRWEGLEVATLPASPTILDLALVWRFKAAMGRWAAAGFRVVGWEVLKERRAICRRCPHWVRRSLVPKCAVCGCAGLKLWLATEGCPEGRWKALFKGAEDGVREPRLQG